MGFFTRVLLSALVPVLGASIGFYFLLQQQASEFEVRITEVLSERLLKQRQQALADVTEIANAAIEFIPVAQQHPQAPHQELTKELLTELGYGTDGYFYAYTLEGINLVHPILPDLVGQNLIDWRDVNGNPLIQNLIKAARAGTGFHSYTWHRPSTDSDEPKIGYVIDMPQWQWMIGTGVYTDDIDQEVALVRASIADNFRQTELSLFFIMLLAVVATSGLLSLFRFTEGRTANRQLRELASDVVKAQETERKRVSLELHDGIGQTLVSSLYAIENAELTPDKANEFLARASQGIRDAIEESRRVSRGLRPAALDDLGLGEAIRQLTRSVSEAAQITAHLDVASIDFAIKAEAKTTVYRVTQEALANATKHSGATNVNVSIAVHHHHVVLTVADNGIGVRKERLYPNNLKRSLGVTGMRERVEGQGGQFSIRSAPGAGTTVTVKFPIKSSTSKSSH